jgi:hypothetical protein
MKRAEFKRAVGVAGSLAALARVTGALPSDLRLIQADPSRAMAWFADKCRGVVKRADLAAHRAAQAARREREASQARALAERERKAEERARRADAKALAEAEREEARAEKAFGKRLLAERDAENLARFWAMFEEGTRKLVENEGKASKPQPVKAKTGRGSITGLHVEGYRWTKRIFGFYPAVRSQIRGWLEGHRKARADWPFWQAVGVVALYTRGKWLQAEGQKTEAQYKTVRIQLAVEPSESGDFTIKYPVATGRSRRKSYVTGDLVKRLDRLVAIDESAPPPDVNLCFVYSVELRNYRVRTEAQVRSIATTRRRERCPTRRKKSSKRTTSYSHLR